MMLKVYVFIAIAEIAFAQLVTYKDGKVGVNFAGYSADAGLGEILTGNSANGGLSASAKTPLGQRAAAGLEKNGEAYADASAGEGIDAGAAIGNPKKVSTVPIIHSEENKKSDADSAQAPRTVYVQKVRPRKYYRLNKVVRTANEPKSVILPSSDVAKVVEAPHYNNRDTVLTGTKTVELPGTFFDNIFNIPISVLKSVNTLLNNRGQSGSFGVSKSYEYA